MGMIEYSGESEWTGMVEMDAAALVASAVDIPVKPPKQWFDDPGLTRLTPLTVEKDGRVFGHIASWEGSHIGRLGKVKPPRSKSKYQYFRHGVVETDDGSEIPVGQITLVGGHADMHDTMQAAVAHYDNTDSAVMDVTVGEDQQGIWVAGALRPGVDDIKIRAIKASGVSGDWRPIENRLELVAICAVNVPGFPIPRALAADALDEDGHLPIYALVAAGAGPLYAVAHKDPSVEALEYALIDIESKMDWMRTSLAVLAAAEYGDEDEDEEDVVISEDEVDYEPEPEAEPVAEAETVPEEPDAEPVAEAEDSSDEEQLEFDFAFDDSLDGEALAQEILASGKADLLWDDGLPIQFSLPQCEAVALRLKFRRAVAVDSGKRAAALTSGAAMPDGRLPILTDDDLYSALLIVPEDTVQYEHLVRRSQALGLDIADMRQDVLVASVSTEKYDFKQRLKMVKTGEAMKGGAFPIKDEEDLKNAIQAYGRGKDKAATKAHIMRRARALKKVDVLPDKWED